MFGLLGAERFGLKAYLAIMMASVLLGCDAFDSQTVPEELLGAWETAEHRHKRCSLEVTGEQIIFANGGDFVDINTIRGIKRVDEAKRVLYEIECENQEGGEYRLSLYYSHSNKTETIQFKHQPHIRWVRKREDSQLMEDRPDYNVHIRQPLGVDVSLSHCAGIKA
jgi:hypothetical protein